MDINILYFQNARQAVERGLSCEKLIRDDKKGLEAIRAEAERLIELCEAAVQSRQILSIQPLTSSHCRQAAEIAAQALNGLPSGYANWWIESVRKACQQLRGQVKPVDRDPGDLFSQGSSPIGRITALLDNVDPWLGLAVLNPGDDDAKQQILTIFHNTWRELNGLIEQRVNDFNADGVPRILSNNSKIEDSKLLQHQIRMDQSLYNVLINLKDSLRVCAENDPKSYKNYQDDVNRLEHEVKNWLQRLLDFQQSINKIQFMADEQVLKKGDTERVTQIIGQAHAANNEDPISSGLVGFGAHPTLVWLQDQYITERSRRYNNEARRVHRFNWYIALQDVATEKQIKERFPRDDTSYQDKDLVEEALQFIHSSTPLEIAFNILEEMKCEEPEDATLLQFNLSCKSFKKPGQEIRGMVVIHAELKPLVEQIRSMRRWLGQFQALPGPAIQERECPGIVNWEEESLSIYDKLLSGQIGEALDHCRSVGTGETGDVKSGDRDPLTLWPLQKAITALGSVPEPLRTPLSESARNLEKERKDIIDSLKKQLDENKKLEQRIDETGRQVNQAWTKLLDALEQFERGGWRQRENSKKLREAAENYHRLCPKETRWLDLRSKHSDIEKVWMPKPIPTLDELYKSVEDRSKL